MGCRELYAMPPANICWQPFCPHILSHRPWSSWNQSSLGFPQAALYLSGVPRTLGASWSARSYSLSHPQPSSCLPFQTNSARAGHLLNWGLPGQWFTGALSLPSILSPWSPQGICHKKNLWRRRSFCFLTLPTQVLPRSGSPSSIFHNSLCSFLHVWFCLSLSH